MSNLILVNHFLLFHLFNSYNFVSFSVSTNSDLSKCSSSNDLPRNEVFYWYLSPLKPIILWLFMKNLLFDKVFLLIWKLHLVHLSCQLIPSFFSFPFFKFRFSVFTFNIRFCASSFLFGTITSSWSGRSTCGCCSCLALCSSSHLWRRWSFIRWPWRHLSFLILLHFG